MLPENKFPLIVINEYGYYYFKTQILFSFKIKRKASPVGHH